jgi:hypothetical protein
MTTAVMVPAYSSRQVLSNSLINFGKAWSLFVFDVVSFALTLTNCHILLRENYVKGGHKLVAVGNASWVAHGIISALI